MEIHYIIIGISLGIILLLVFYGMVYNEKDAYNGGRCPICGGKLILFKVDKDGRKHFACPRCKKYTCSTKWYNTEAYK